VPATGYLRFPHIHDDLIVFVAADAVWLAPVSGGRAWRFTAESSGAATPRFSADGTRLAWSAGKDGGMEIYEASVADGQSTRLTYWGELWARVSGWTPAGEVLAVSSAGAPFRVHHWARAVTTELSGGPGPERLLPYGPVADLCLVADDAAGGTVALLNGTWGTEPAYWKRYRGGTAGRLWIGPATAALMPGSQSPAGQSSEAPAAEPASDGERPFRRLLADLPTQFASPMLAGGRVAFISDHEGTGNIYSCAPDGSDLRRHTDHDGWYARHASTDGHRIVYACGGELWLLADVHGSMPERLDIVLGSPVPGRAPRLITARDHVGSLSVDRSGTASAVEVRGTVHWLTHRDGPAMALSVTPGVRARYPQVLGDAGQVVWATDADGIDAIEVGGGDQAATRPATTGDPEAAPRRLAAGQVGRIWNLAAAPDGSAVAVAAQDGRLLVVDAGSGQVRELAASDNGPVSGMAWSPDSAWLVWSEPTDRPGGSNLQPLRRLRLARLADGQVTDVTDGRFVDTEPVFTLDGKYLAFLSQRSFDPIYDAHFFDLSFPYGARPYLLPLSAATLSPFGPQLGGRPIGDGNRDGADDGGDRRKPDEAAGAGGPGATGEAGGQPESSAQAGTPGSRGSYSGPAVVVDTDGIADRVVQLPVPESRYSRLRALKDGLAWLRQPVIGNLGTGGARPTDDAPRGVIERFDFGRRETTELTGDVDWFEASKDGTRLVVSDHDDLTVIPGAHKADHDNPDDRVHVDASRARFMAEPMEMWRQAYAEAFRIMRHDYWVPDMADVDWDAVQDEYRPLLDRIASESDFRDVLWEVFGELGTSHAYAFAEDSGLTDRASGVLGADLERTADGWRLTRIVREESSDPRARSPLTAPGTLVGVGDLLTAVDGQPVGPEGPGPLLAGAAGKPVELTVIPAAAAGPDGSQRRRVAVVPLRSDRRLRYLDWVATKRAQVRELGGGRLGYLHVPDMMSEGWADFGRDLRSEMLRDGLIVDVRSNGGGHTSELVIEKLARRVVGWDVPSARVPATYPNDAPRGALVAIADEFAGSDGDIVTAAFKLLELGPVVGARTWGGVVGYDEEHHLVDGTQMTVPRLAFWFERLGWGVENYGVDPDVEVIPTPDDWAAGRDPQLETAVRVALEALEARPALRPPDVSSRASRRRPPLPPRSA
jgi:tricorn protease